jgi:aminoglycoside 3-N-acetyltransferase
LPADPREWLKDRIVRHFLSWDAAALAARLAASGVQRGDWLMLHASWQPRSGFTGKPRDLIAALAGLVGREGLLIMPSLPYHNQSTAEFLRKGKPIDLRRIPSAMGLLSEVFRRTPGVVRSPSPTHPLLALGDAAADFAAGHERAEVPFGADSPFARLLEHDAWIAGLDVGFGSFTFTHAIEDRIAGSLPFPLYEAEPLHVEFTDASGNPHATAVRVISDQANARRDERPFIARLQRASVLKSVRVGNSRVLLARCAAMVRGAEDMVREGGSLFRARDVSDAA